MTLEYQPKKIDQRALTQPLSPNPATTPLINLPPHRDEETQPLPTISDEQAKILNDRLYGPKQS